MYAGEPGGRYHATYQPAILLPDLSKDYESDRLIVTMWDALDQSIEWADRILIIGHSLHDENLVGHLESHRHDTALGVGYYWSPHHSGSQIEFADPNIAINCAFQC